MTAPGPDIERLFADEAARRQPPKRLPPLDALKREFQAVSENHYRLNIREIGVTLEIVATFLAVSYSENERAKVIELPINDYGLKPVELRN